jgi:5-methylcytosine-specific restriction endonuclease McrA
MDGSLIIVFLLVSYAVYEALFTPDRLSEGVTDYDSVPYRYYKSYRRYLQSEEWKELKRMRAFLDDNKCTRCGSTDRLQCHHKNYKGIEDMSFSLSQLETVCESCHKKIHKKYSKSVGFSLFLKPPTITI